MTTKADHMVQTRLAALGGIKDRGNSFADHHRTHWRVAAGQPLGHGHNVGFDVPMFRGEHFAGTTETVDHFVDNQYHAVFVGNLAQLFEVGVGRQINRRRGRNRLGDNRRDGFRSLMENGLLYRINTELRVGFLAHVRVVAVDIVVWHLHAAGHHG